MLREYLHKMSSLLMLLAMVYYILHSHSCCWQLFGDTVESSISETALGNHHFDVPGRSICFVASTVYSPHLCKVHEVVPTHFGEGDAPPVCVCLSLSPYLKQLSVKLLEIPKLRVHLAPISGPCLIPEDLNSVSPFWPQLYGQGLDAKILAHWTLNLNRL